MRQEAGAGRVPDTRADGGVRIRRRSEVSVGNSIVRGAVIAARYVVSDLEHPWIHERPDLGTVCTAIDAILDEPVTAYVAPTETAGDMLDAARRAALLTDPRLPRILDVGRDEAGWDFCVTENTGGVWLRTVLEHGPLEPAQVRALAGEVADVLAGAGRRGLHHLRLGPESVQVDNDGGVHVHGLAIDAAVADHTATTHLDAISLPQARREDALALLDLLYLLSTAHWPGEHAREGFPPAPRADGRPVPVTELNAAADADLSRLLDDVFAGRERGPQSPGELAKYLGDWDREELRGLAGRTPPATSARTAAAAPAPLTKTGPVVPVTPEPLPEPSAEAAASSTPWPPTGGSDRHRATPAQLQAAMRRIRRERPGTTGLAAGLMESDPEDPLAEVLSMRAASTFPVDAEALREAEKHTPAWEPEEPAAEYPPAPASAWDETQQLSTAQEDRGALEEGAEEEDDSSWFLGGMFTTDEEQRRQEAERERRDAEDLARLRRALGERSRQRQDRASERDMSPGALAPAAPAGAPRPAEAGDAEQADPAHDSSESEESPATQALPVIEAPGENAAVSEPAGDRGPLGAAPPTPGIPAPPAPDVPAPPAPASAPAGSAAESETGDDSADAVQAKHGEGAGSASATGARDGRTRTPLSLKGGGAVARGKRAPALRPGPEKTPRPASQGVKVAPTAPGATAAAATAPANAAPEDREERRRRIALILAVLAAVVIVAVVVGLVLVNRDGEQSALPPAPTAETEEPQGGEEEEHDEPEPELVNPVVIGAEDLDPEGDGEEKPELVDNVLPDVSGAWMTDTYNSPEFGNLKSGLGLRLDLEEEADLGVVEVISSAAGGRFEIRAGDDDPAQAEVLAEGSFASGTERIELDEPVRTGHFFLWITELPADGGGYRAVIDEVSAAAE